MARFIVVGAGLYGLIAAKTYLQVTGAYDREEKDRSNDRIEIPTCFTENKQLPSDPQDRLLVLDSASSFGGTWAEERLYPNLLSQNSYGLYEFSDLSLADVVPEDSDSDPGDTHESKRKFIAGWKINRYLRIWVAKWKLEKYIRLRWTVESVSRLESKEWKIIVNISTTPNRRITLICDKLILATGLTSVPHMPDIGSSSGVTDHSAAVIHAKDVGEWTRRHLGYQPIKPKVLETKISNTGAVYPQLRRVAIYGGAKSSFDLVHFFATLHRNDPKLHLQFRQECPVQVHWVIRDRGAGVAWMVPPTSTLPNGETVASDKAASTRLFSYFNPCCYMIPKRLSRKGLWGLHWEGSWLVWLLHGNPLGRWWIRRFWQSVDRGLEQSAQYESDAKMNLLRPNNSVISCASGIGIANQDDLWEAIRLPHVNVYRSSITELTVPSGEKKTTDSTQGVTVLLADGSCVDSVDLVVHATGYKPILPIRFEPASLRLGLGLSALIVKDDKRDSEDSEIFAGSPEKICGPLEPSIKARIERWEEKDEQAETKVRKTLSATKCAIIGRKAPSWADPDQLVPYRLFRRMVAPELVAEGDRSFATVGVILSSTIAVIAEVQALWVAAFLTGGLDANNLESSPNQALHLATLPQDAMEHEISEDAVLGSLLGSGLEVDAIQYNDMLLRDLGLNQNRLSGTSYQELTGVYGPSAYRGIVDEWRQRRSHGNKS